MGGDIVFGMGQYAPSTTRGQRLIAHELTHVTQQTSGSHNSVQRQDIGDLPGVTPAGPSPVPSPTGTPPIVPIPQAIEPHCPKVPTNLGLITPDPPCGPPTEEFSGISVHFCEDSDVFANPADVSRLKNFAQHSLANSTFTVHGFSSIERSGQETYNLNLSCHRAKRVARELINAGVRSERLEIHAHGGTHDFDTGQNVTENQRANRVALVDSIEPPPSPELPQTKEPTEIRQRAIDKLINGDYLLGADAYITRWSCGRIPSLAEAVARTTVKIEEIDAPKLTSEEAKRLGSVDTEGLNQITLSKVSFSTDDPLGCVMSRIADMTFHHMVRSQLPQIGPAHKAALHLLHLAGLGPCVVSPNPFLNRPGEKFSEPSSADPQVGKQPACADRPLAGPITPQQRGPHPAQPPQFSIDLFLPLEISGAVTQGRIARIGGIQFVEMSVPPGTLKVFANVRVDGDPKEIQHWELGFLQTVVAEDMNIFYVSGDRLTPSLPLPLRDGVPARLGGRPPWFDPRQVVPAQQGIIGGIVLSDSPGFVMPGVAIDPERSQFFGPNQQLVPLGPTLPGPAPKQVTQLLAVLDKAVRETVFDTWVVARRRDAFNDRFSTHFIRGTKMTFRETVDFVGGQGRGSFTVTKTDAQEEDQVLMQFAGATPADYEGKLNLQYSFEKPPSWADAGGLSFSQFRTEVRQIADPHRRRLGLTQGCFIFIKIDPATGHTILDTDDLRLGAVRVETEPGSPPVPPALGQELAKAIFPEVRKLVAGPDPAFGSGASLKFIMNELR